MWFLTTENETKETFGGSRSVSPVRTNRNQVQFFLYFYWVYLCINFYCIQKPSTSFHAEKIKHFNFAKKYVFCFLNENLKNKHFLYHWYDRGSQTREGYREFWTETKWPFLVLLMTINLTLSYFKTSSKGRAYFGKKSWQGWILNIFCAEHVNTLPAHLHTKGRHLHSPELPQYGDN